MSLWVAQRSIHLISLIRDLLFSNDVKERDNIAALSIFLM